MRGDVPERASGGGLAAAPGLGVLAYAGFAPGIADRRFAEPATTGHRECAGYAFALTYGPGTDWVKNVLAAGSCELRTRGRTVKLVSPRVSHDESRRAIRPFERQVPRVLGVADFLTLKTAPAAATSPGQPRA